MGTVARFETPEGRIRRDVVVDDGVLRRVELRRGVLRGSSHAHTVPDTLAERARRRLDARRVAEPEMQCMLFCANRRSQ